MRESPPRSLRRNLAIALGILGLAGGAFAACGGDGFTGTGGSSGGGECSCSDPAAPVCNPATGQCVGCLPGGGTCGAGSYCAPATFTCAPGCEDQAGCAAPQQCNQETHQCVDCLLDTDCPDGLVCATGGTCAQGCSASKPCDGALTCCDGACADTTSDALHCGSCDGACPTADHATVACVGSQCQIGSCDGGFADCDGNTTNGCEHDLATGDCACTPGDTMSCYTGPVGTEGVGSCVGGVSTCNADGTSWGPCDGQVTPLFDACGDGQDQDCSGGVDDPPDADGDGFGPCDGDCCDDPITCGSPELVNPGAFEVAGNLVDDDCNGGIDDVLAACDAGLPSNSGNAMEYGQAIDLCQTTAESPPTPAQKTWGLISGGFFLADGQGSPASSSRAIRTGFGGGVTPLSGSSLAVLSTGYAAAQAAPNNANPAFKAFQGGQDMGKSSGMPSDWLAANGNNLPNAPGCPDPQGGTTAHDPILLKLRVRVPTNASSFSVSTFYYSSEYPEWVCSAFNDFFVALLDSGFQPGPGQSPNPADKNLAFYDPPPVGGPVYPVGVNLAFGNTGLFTQCKNGSTGCGSGAIAGSTSTCAGTNQLTGTGFDIANPPSQFPGDPAYCGNSNLAGGGTGWLTTSGNVTPGETIELRFAVWDTGDQWYDSLVLLDNFQWSVSAATPGTHQ